MLYCVHMLCDICYICILLFNILPRLYKITEVFVAVTGFVSCSPSPCKNGGLCVSSPRGESHCKWV